MYQDQEKLSRTLAHALRHAPEKYGLMLDEYGYAEISDLIESLKKYNRRFADLTEADLDAIIDDNEKKRYEKVGTKIKALYGHSIEIKFAEPGKPPRTLYHGTTRENAERILQEGLKPAGRHYVHLSSDMETAREIGLRRTEKPVILQINCQRAWVEGVQFYPGNDKTWLSDSIPPDYISRIYE